LKREKGASQTGRGTREKYKYSWCWWWKEFIARYVRRRGKDWEDCLNNGFDIWGLASRKHKGEINISQDILQMLDLSSRQGLGIGEKGKKKGGGGGGGGQIFKRKAKRIGDHSGKRACRNPFKKTLEGEKKKGSSERKGPNTTVGWG